MPRNKALDAFLNKSKEINTQLAEDPEARAAALEIQAGELKEPDTAHADPTDEEPPAPLEEVSEEAEHPDEAAAQAESQAAAETAAAAEGDKPVADDDRERELKATRAERDRLRREREESRRQLAEARRLLAERQAQPVQQETRPAAVEPRQEEVKDPEPNRETHPVDWSEWKLREMDRQLLAERAERAALADRFSRIEQQNSVEQQTRQFDSLMEQERSLYLSENPDFEAKRNYLREQIRRELSLLNIQPGVLELELANRERQFLAQQAKIAHDLGEAQVGQYALQKLSEMAEIRGYRAEAAANGTQPPANGTSKAKPAATPAEKIRDGRERANAARTASTMSSTPATTRDPNKRMTAEEFLRMNAAQRALYRKQNPTWIDDTFSAGESDTNPLLIGR